MKKNICFIISLLMLCGCSNNLDTASADVRFLHMIKDNYKILIQTKKPLNVRNIITRSMIEEASVPLLFVEKSNGENGTLKLYPGVNLEEIWYSADGATISLFNGELLSTRGMKNDIIHSLLPKSRNYNERLRAPYKKIRSYLSSENIINNILFICEMIMYVENTSIEIFDKVQIVSKYQENCVSSEYSVQNQYWQNTKGDTVKSLQWHSKSEDYILIMRLK